MALVKLPATDIGEWHVPLVFDQATGEIKQDPSWVQQYAPPGSPVNIYQPGDVFLSTSGGTITYEALLNQIRQTSVVATPNNGDITGSGGGSNGGGGNPGPIKQGGALETTFNEIIAVLERPIWPNDPKSWPTWTVALGAGAAYAVLSRRRRR